MNGVIQARSSKAVHLGMQGSTTVLFGVALCARLLCARVSMNLPPEAFQNLSSGVWLVRGRYLNKTLNYTIRLAVGKWENVALFFYFLILIF